MGPPPFSTVGFPFCIIISILLQIASLAAAAVSDTIPLGGSLSGSQTIISADGLFKLGLFPLPTGSSSMYLGIWYASVTPFTSVWVANREEPVTQAATFGLSAEGGLTLTDRGRVVWTKGSNFKNISSAILKDTGNFVLTSSNSTIMWQSFDEPGDTWLPTMSLGPGRQIRSWLTPNDPSLGPYALQMGESKNEFISIYNGSRQYWTSGAWNGQIFSNVQEMTANWIYNFTLNQSGFTWYVKPDVGINFNVSRFVMTNRGQIRQSSYVPGKGWNVYWNQPKDPCDVIGVCGINGICNSLSEPNCKCPDFGFQPVNKAEWDDSTLQVSIHGCERVSPLNCSLGISNDGFYALNGTLFMNSASSLQVEDKGKCQDLCLKNCSCSSFYYEGSSRNCSIFVGNLFNGRQTSTSGTFYVRISAKDMPTSDHSSKSSSSGKVIGAAIGGVAAIMAAGALIVGYVMMKRKRRQRADGEAGLRAFTYAELQAATKNFRDKLGCGGFGGVYKGVVESVIIGAGGRGSSTVPVARNMLMILSWHYVARTPSTADPHDRHTLFFPIFAARLIHQPNTDLTSLVDPRLQGDFNAEELRRIVYSAIWCIQDNEDWRPSMGKVVQVLEGSISITAPPVPTSLQCLIDLESSVQDTPPRFSSST